LIGPDTIDTLPLETIDAYRDHGKPKQTLDRNVADAHRILDALPSVGIDLDAATDQLEQEGVEKFNAALDKLMASLKKKQTALREPAGR
jgi:transaldolase